MGSVRFFIRLTACWAVVLFFFSFFFSVFVFFFLGAVSFLCIIVGRQAGASMAEQQPSGPEGKGPACAFFQ
jgi:hypothetical protein